MVILEASNAIGGRVKQTTSFLKSGMPVDLGAEIVHGDDNAVISAAKEGGWLLHKFFVWSQGDGGPLDEPASDGGIAYYYHGTDKKLMRYNEIDEDQQKLHDVLWSLSEKDPEDFKSDKRSLEDFLRDEGVAERVLDFANAGYSNTAGTAKAAN